MAQKPEGWPTAPSCVLHLLMTNKLKLKQHCVPFATKHAAAIPTTLEPRAARKDLRSHTAQLLNKLTTGSQHNTPTTQRRRPCHPQIYGLVIIVVVVTVVVVTVVVATVVVANSAAATKLPVLNTPELILINTLLRIHPKQNSRSSSLSSLSSLSSSPTQQLQHNYRF